MQHHAERMARLKQLIAQLDRMHRQVANVIREVAEINEPKPKRGRKRARKAR